MKLELKRLHADSITNAIKRIDAGTYGLCSECGGEIEAKRLDAIPYIGTCISCALEKEARG